MTNNTLLHTLTSLLISHILGEYAKMVATVSLLTSTFKGITLKLIFKTWIFFILFSFERRHRNVSVHLSPCFRLVNYNLRVIYTGTIRLTTGIGSDQPVVSQNGRKSKSIQNGRLVYDSTRCVLILYSGLKKTLMKTASRPSAGRWSWS